jgi:hypothetical protein
MKKGVSTPSITMLLKLTLVREAPSVQTRSIPVIPSTICAGCRVSLALEGITTQFEATMRLKAPREAVPNFKALAWLLITQLVMATSATPRSDSDFRQMASSSQSRKQSETITR